MFSAEKFVSCAVLSCIAIIVFLNSNARPLPNEHAYTVHSLNSADPSSLDEVCSGLDIPVVVIAFNNPTITALLVNQLRDCFDANVILIDMFSSFSGMSELLANLTTNTSDPRLRIIKSLFPGGPRDLFDLSCRWVALMDSLPRFFALTDSDMRLGDNTPRNFLCVMAHALHRINTVDKVGLALDLSDRLRMWQLPDYYNEQNIWDFESSLWKNVEAGIAGLPELDGVVYDSAVDTIFAMYDKTLLSCSKNIFENPHGYHAINIPCFSASAVRIGGIFTAQHRPWYPETFLHLMNGELEANRGGGGTLFQMFLRAGWQTNLSKSFDEYLLKYPIPRLTVQEKEQSGGIMNFVCRGLHFPLRKTLFRPPVSTNFQDSAREQTAVCN